MPTTYKRKPGKRKYKDFDEKTLNKRMLLKNTNTLHKSQAYGISKSTLHRKFKDLNFHSPGNQIVLTKTDK